MLGGSAEENFLTALVHSEILAPHIALDIKASDFSIRVYQQIAGAALGFLEQYGRPAGAHIADVLEDELRRSPDSRFMRDVLEQLATLAPSLNEDYVRNTLDEFVETRRLVHAVNTASDLLRAGDLEHAREILRTPNLGLHRDTPGVWLRDTENWFGFLRDDDAREFVSGIETLDERGVAPARGELLAFLAAAGMGKSWFLINLGKHNLVERRKKVLHVTLENSLAVTLQRYTQCFLALTRTEERHLDIPIFADRGDRDLARREHLGPRAFESLKSVNLEELKRRLEPFQTRGQLLVKHFPTGVLTFGMLNAFLDTLDKNERFKPDIVLLDYLTLMHLETRGDNIRIAIGQLARRLRGLAAARDCAVVTALQANRAAAGRRTVYSNMVGEDWSLVGTVDTMLTYSQTSHERRLGVARILVDKARNASDKWLAFIQQEYEIGQFCTDSAYMSKSLEEQLGEPPEE